MLRGKEPGGVAAGAVLAMCHNEAIFSLYQTLNLQVRHRRYITYCLICGLKSSLRPKIPQRNNFPFLLTDISSIMYCSFFILSGGSELGKMKIMNHGCLWAEGREGSRQCQLPSNCDSRLLLLSNHSTSNLCHCQRVRATTKLQVACAGV